MTFARINVSVTEPAKGVFLNYQRTRHIGDQNSAMTELLLEVKEYLKTKQV